MCRLTMISPFLKKLAHCRKWANIPLSCTEGNVFFLHVYHSEGKVTAADTLLNKLYLCCCAAVYCLRLHLAERQKKIRLTGKKKIQQKTKADVSMSDIIHNSFEDAY